MKEFIFEDLDVDKDSDKCNRRKVQKVFELGLS